jgi:hypothetical protein
MKAILNGNGQNVKSHSKIANGLNGQKVVTAKTIYLCLTLLDHVLDTQRM